MTILSLWAQSLDNVAPDHIEVVTEGMSREDAVSAVYTVIEAGRTIYRRGGVKLTHCRSRLVLEVEAADLDHLGRRTPLVCTADYTMDSISTLNEEVSSSLKDFAARLHRTVPLEQLAFISEALHILKKKSAQQTAVPIALLVIGILALALGCYWLSLRG